MVTGTIPHQSTTRHCCTGLSKHCSNGVAVRLRRARQNDEGRVSITTSSRVRTVALPKVVAHCCPTTPACKAATATESVDDIINIIAMGNESESNYCVQ
jgi:hypothetical protein